MWSAVNWLSSKAGINLEEATEVMHSTSGFYNQQGIENDDPNGESSKENQSISSNGNISMATHKKKWKTSRYSTPSVTNSPTQGLGGASPIVPLGSGFRTPISGVGHSSVPPIMVPTNSRNSSPGYTGHLHDLPSAGKLSPSALPWKDVR